MAERMSGSETGQQLVGCYAEWLVGWVGRRVQMVGVWGGDRAEKLDEWVGNFAASTRSGSQGAPP